VLSVFSDRQRKTSATIPYNIGINCSVLYISTESMLSLSALAVATSHDGRRLFVGRKGIKHFYSFTIFQLFFSKRKKG